MIDHLDKNQLRIVRIGLKKLPQSAKWDELELGFEMMEIEELELPIDLEITGFESMEIDSLIDVAGEPAADDEDLPVPVADGPAVSRLGDMWHCGDHLVLCGNSLEAESFERLMGNDRAQMINTDYPYNLKQSEIGGLGKNKYRDFFEAAGEKSEEEFIGHCQSNVAVSNLC